MKPCVSRRESVALLACGVCPDDQAAELRHHLRSCAGCRESFVRLREVCDDHATAAAQLPEARVPSRLASRVASRIRAASESPGLETKPDVYVGWVRIVGLAALLSVMVIGAIRICERFKPSPALHVTVLDEPNGPPPARSVSVSAAGNSLGAYRFALGRSPEALEELLSQEAAKPNPNPHIAWLLSPKLQELEL